MLILSWQLTIVAVSTVPVFFWLTKMVGERRRRVARSTQESLAAMSALAEETLSVSGVLLAKGFGNQARDTARYHRENQRLARPEAPPAEDGAGLLRDGAVVPVDPPGGGVPGRRPAAGARHGHLRGHHRRVPRAADPPVLPGRAAAAGLGGAAIVAGPVRPGRRVPR